MTVPGAIAHRSRSRRIGILPIDRPYVEFSLAAADPEVIALVSAGIRLDTGYIVGTDGNVPSGLTRSTNPASAMAVEPSKSDDSPSFRRTGILRSSAQRGVPAAGNRDRAGIELIPAVMPDGCGDV